jgi:hypothetical protein
MKVLREAFIHLGLLRLGLVVREHESDGVAAALTLEEEIS